jgi:hypothetical protein
MLKGANMTSSWVLTQMLTTASGAVSIPFTTKFIFCIFIIIQYSIPVNSTYHTVEINELSKTDVFSVAPHENISTWCQNNRTQPKCSPACQKGRHLTQRKIFCQIIVRKTPHCVKTRSVPILFSF